MFHSREHGCIYHVPLSLHGFSSYKLPHKDGEKSTVASPPSKTFVKYAADGVLTSPGGEAKEARAVGGS